MKRLEWLLKVVNRLNHFLCPVEPTPEVSSMVYVGTLHPAKCFPQPGLCLGLRLFFLLREDEQSNISSYSHCCSSAIKMVLQ